MTQCAGLPALSSSVVGVQFLSAAGARTLITTDQNGSAPYIVRVPSEAIFGCGSRLNESGPLINCTRFDGAQWLLDGVPIERNLTHVACAFSATAAAYSSGVAAFCAPAPRYDELDLTTAVPEPAVQLTGLYVCCVLLPAIIFAHALELSALRESRRTAKMSRKIEYRERVGKYGHRDTHLYNAFESTVEDRHTPSEGHLKGNPHTKAVAVILITTPWPARLVCSVIFQSQDGSFCKMEVML